MSVCAICLQHIAEEDEAFVDVCLHRFCFSVNVAQWILSTQVPCASKRLHSFMSMGGSLQYNVIMQEISPVLASKHRIIHWLFVHRSTDMMAPQSWRSCLYADLAVAVHLKVGRCRAKQG